MSHAFRGVYRPLGGGRAEEVFRVVVCKIAPIHSVEALLAWEHRRATVLDAGLDTIWRLRQGAAG